MARVRRAGVQVLNPHSECLAEITIEYPYLQERYEEFRGAMSDAHGVARRQVQLAVFRDAEKTYETNTGERVAHWQRRLLGRYTRNLALVNQELAARIFDITVAARSVVDDNYAWEVWEAANRYPAQKIATDLMTVKISGDEVWLDTKRMRLRRWLPSKKRRLPPLWLKPPEND